VVEALAALLPPGVGAWSAAILIVLSFFTSALTGALGLGGGLLMLAVMGLLLPPTVLIPVHGVVQVGSNFGRAVLMREHVVWGFVLPFVIGSAIGVALGAQIVTAVQTPLLLMVLGLFVLWSAWAGRLKPARIPAKGFFLVGAASSFSTMFVGATGPLVAGFLVPDPLTRHQTVATHATFMLLQHGLKLTAFWALGFAFLRWLPMLLVMIALGFLGTMAGKRLLDRVPEGRFALAFKLVLSALALQLLIEGARAWIAHPGTTP